MRRGETNSFIETVCGVLFCIFTLCYIYFFQSDLLAYTQYIYSDGLTAYNTFVGSVLITVSLLVVTVLVRRFLLRNLSCVPSLSYAPALMALAVVTDDHLSESGIGIEEGSAVWYAVFMVAIVFLINYLFKRIHLFGRLVTQLDYLKSVALNTSLLLVLCLLSVFVSNTFSLDHMALKCEYLLESERYSDVIKLQDKYIDSTPHLTMCRALSLAKTDELGERFFEHELTPGSQNLLPTADNHFYFYSQDVLNKTVGGVSKRDIEPKKLLQTLYRKGRLRCPDYLLTAYLMDCDLNSFACTLKEVDNDSLQSLPKHYREALVLYRHLHRNPIVNYTQPELETDYQDFQELIKKYPEGTLRNSAIRDTYGNSYWYYFFTNRKALIQLVSKQN